MMMRVQKLVLMPCLVGLSLFLLYGLSSYQIVVDAKELPVAATIQELLSQPEQYDGHRVFVTGRVRTVKMETGRRGSEFLGMVLEDVTPKAADDPSVRVFSFTIPRIDTGNRVLVQGTYHHHGRFGGWPYDDFIDADAIIRDK